MGPGNTVDIGIFDPRGRDFLDGCGFRGWSGTAKREFFIGPHEATPGYIRGPLAPGDWHILLGFGRVNPEGVRYEVTVNLTLDERDPHPAEIETGEASPTASPQPRGRGRAGRRSSGGRGKGALHCHPVHSDGLNTVDEIVASAVERGLDFL